MQNDAVPYRHTFFENERILILHYVQNRTVLDIAARADTDPVHVAANHRPRPHAGMFADGDVADDDGRRVDVSRLGDLRPAAVIAADHFLPRVLTSGLSPQRLCCLGIWPPT